MILDNLLMFEPTAKAIAATGASTNTIDLGADRSLGVTEFRAFVLVDTTFTTADGGTLNIQYQTSPDNAAWTTQIETGALAVGVLTANAFLLNTSVPREMGSPLGLIQHRYHRLNYVVANNFTAGKIVAGLTKEVDAPLQYAAGITINN